jgi:hypothetical protein
MIYSMNAFRDVTQRNILEDSHLHTRHLENQKFHNDLSVVAGIVRPA